MIEKFHLLALQGLAVLGDRTYKYVGHVLTGALDQQLKCAFFTTFHQGTPANQEDLETPKVMEALELVKSKLREHLQKAFKDEADRAAAVEKEAEHRRVLENLKNTNKPHELGTVSEISAKYGMSKSEVRRRKADGTLENFIINQTCEAPGVSANTLKGETH